MVQEPANLPFRIDELEERKRAEIEHSRIRRSILQNSERSSDTNEREQAANLESLIRDKELFEKHFANIKYYSVARRSEQYQHELMRRYFKPGARVLDFACGNGENGIFAAKLGCDVRGMDISPEGVSNANLNAQESGVSNRCSFEVMDGENMSYPDNFFDAAVEYGALHHVDLDKALSELARVIKPGGSMICVEALRHNPLIHAYRRRTPHLRTAWEVDHILGVESLNVVRKHFETVEVRFFHLAVLAAVPFRKTRLFPIMRRVLERVDDVLLSIPGVGKYGWIMVLVMAGPKKSSLRSAR
jgi:ubiquinone/menaquinone biosynthesis C-methylase UbiE